MDFQAGEVLLVDKDKGWTSFDVVNKIRYALKKALDVKKIKVGHAGTLDPLATGLLVVCTGKMTKQINDIAATNKEYEGTIAFGMTSPSYDLETETEIVADHKLPTKVELEQAMKIFVGTIFQTPPIFSAKKVDGERAYHAARQGRDIEMKRQQITIQYFDIIEYDSPNLRFRLGCSKGTYVRSLAHDLGQVLGCGGVLADLRRTKVGDHDVSEALQIDAVVQMIETDS